MEEAASPTTQHIPSPANDAEESLIGSHLNKIHPVTLTFVPLMSFWTQRLCNMLDSQAPAFQCDIR